jgi:thioesterase domain-containing protein
VPGAGANVVSFTDLMGHLDAARPIYGLQPRGLDGALVAHTSVEAAAVSYMRAIDDVQPTGPVHLLGHSFGGWVVFEMALRFRAAGRVIGSLTIVDSEVPRTDAALAEQTSADAFRELVESFELSAERSLDITPAQVEALDETGRLRLLHERLVAFGMMPRRSTADVLRGPYWAFSTCLRTTYEPSGKYADAMRLVLVPSTKRDDDANRAHFAESAAGWRRWAPALVCTQGAGNHMTMLKTPHVAALAALLADRR